MGEGKAKNILIAAVIWILIIGVLSVAAKFLILPYFRKDLMDKTGSESLYKHEISIAADSFSGYCILRSPVLKKELKNQGIKLTVKDDHADYEARMNALEKRDIQMAVFTIDSFILTGAKKNNFPATIVMVIDESRGADAIVAHKSAVTGIQDLNHANAGIVLTPNSPSEFLSRTVIAHFELPLLPEKWMVPADGAEAVFKAFQKVDPAEKKAFVLWEPYVSRALKIPDAHLLMDSSKLKGYIVDVLVAERNFLINSPELVQTLIASYLKAAHAYSQQSGTMADLVMADAGLTGAESMDRETAARMVQRIEWKNTLENYAHFGLLTGKAAGGLMHIEEMIANITDVLVKTGTLPADPLQGREHTLFHDRILAQLQQSDFHPGKKVDIIQGLGSGTADLEPVPQQARLRALTDEEWQRLVPVGALRIEPISFARGTARINIQSGRELETLARRLASWPQYYLRVVGHTRDEGNREANFQLARERAEAAAAGLVAAGVDPNRVRAEALPSLGTQGEAQSVSFILGQLPF